MEKKICPKCQHEIDSKMAFCIFCGEPQSPIGRAEPSQTEPLNQPFEPFGEQKNTKAAANPFAKQHANRTETFPPEPTPQQWPRREEAYAPQNDRSYEPPQPTYRPTSYTGPIYTGENGGGMGWIVFMRVILWIIFAAGVVASVIGGIQMMDYGLELEGIGVIAGGILASFIIVGGGMVALNSASNTRKTANNTAKIIKILQNR